jgi:hypothetical protein
LANGFIRGQRAMSNYFECDGKYLIVWAIAGIASAIAAVMGNITLALFEFVIGCIAGAVGYWIYHNPVKIKKEEKTNGH